MIFLNEKNLEDIYATGSKTARVGAHVRAVRRAWGKGADGVVGLAGDDDVLALAHMCDATQLMGGEGVGMMMFLALAHMCDATQLMGGGGWG